MYHFKLASNYQTVEFDVDELNIENLKLVADTINEVGKLVQSQSITTNTEKGASKSGTSKSVPASEGQLNALKWMYPKMTAEERSKLTKREAYELMKNYHKDSEEDE